MVADQDQHLVSCLLDWAQVRSQLPQLLLREEIRYPSHVDRTLILGPALLSRVHCSRFGEWLVRQVRNFSSTSPFRRYSFLLFGMLPQT